MNAQRNKPDHFPSRNLIKNRNVHLPTSPAGGGGGSKASTSSLQALLRHRFLTKKGGLSWARLCGRIYLGNLVVHAGAVVTVGFFYIGRDRSRGKVPPDGFVDIPLLLFWSGIFFPFSHLGLISGYLRGRALDQKAALRRRKWY